ncbi:hypothetical protein Psi02_63710 [Planotetraspora silvatica]|uniref:Ricin B lectin domain-containing protein n=1 Tax=Planotetraspora silvatica TaxID=234614 RepID=A0A8J3UUA7_9ACTN|nr:hypothetical protein [Planotetraspora silvatica]GII49947.1 hypothetical protein Psi02_63710 [Planotetraspora silvatica]
MRNVIRRSLVVTWSILVAAALFTVPSAPANAAVYATYVASMSPKNSLSQKVAATGVTSRSRLALQFSGGTSQFDMTVVDIYNSQWIVQFRLRYSNLCIDKSLDTTTTQAVYLYPCSGAKNQQWLLQRTGSVSGANVHFIRSWHEGANGRCLAVSTTSEVWPCAYGQDEFAIFTS